MTIFSLIDVVTAAPYKQRVLQMCHLSFYAASFADIPQDLHHWEHDDRFVVKCHKTIYNNWQELRDDAVIAYDERIRKDDITMARFLRACDGSFGHNIGELQFVSNK